MKCDAWQQAVLDFIKTLPPREHEWDNISVSDKAEVYICRHCLLVEERIIVKDISSIMTIKEQGQAKKIKDVPFLEFTPTKYGKDVVIIRPEAQEDTKPENDPA